MATYRKIKSWTRVTERERVCECYECRTRITFGPVRREVHAVAGGRQNQHAGLEVRFMHAESC